jgi:hypothetical protein
VQHLFGELDQPGIHQIERAGDVSDLRLHLVVALVDRGPVGIVHAFD